jgi:hypothetical protein
MRNELRQGRLPGLKWFRLWRTVEKGGGVDQHSEHLDLARRHCAEAVGRVARQRVLLAELHEQGHPTELAADLLNSLIETERQMRAHYAFLLSEDREG